MNAKVIWAALAVLVALVGVFRLIQDRRVGPGSRSWLAIAVVFGVISAWSF